MKTLLIALLFLPVALSAQTKAVLKNPGAKTLTEDLVIPFGRSLTINGTITLPSDVTRLGDSINLDSEVTGQLPWASLSGTPTTLTGYGISDAQPLDSDLTAIAALTTTSYGRSLLTQTSADTLRTSLGLSLSSVSLRDPVTDFVATYVPEEGAMTGNVEVPLPVSGIVLSSDNQATITNKTIVSGAGFPGNVIEIKAADITSGLIAPARLGSGSDITTKYLRGDNTWQTIAGTGTVTSVSGTGTANGLSLSGTVTTTGNITLSGTLSGVSLTTAVTGTLPAANGGTGITSFATGIATFLGTASSANLRAALTDEVGTGAAYFVGGALGTPASGTATNLSGTAANLTAGQATAALGLKTATTTVSISSAAAPIAGQVLTATSSTGGNWQTPAAGSSVPLTIAQASIEADFTVTENATPENVTGMVVALAANKKYRVTFLGQQTSVGTGNGTRLGLNIPSGASMYVSVNNLSGGTIRKGVLRDSGETILHTSGIGAIATSIEMFGIIATGGTAGDVQVIFAAEVVTTGTSATMKEGSLILVEEYANP